jgi:hypothetical protein
MVTINLIFILSITSLNVYSEQWSIDTAQEWYKQQGWLVGCNFIPSTAENTIEMWQDETFDPITIDVELGYAQNIGFNIVRVFLHYLLWQDDPTGFKKNLKTYLKIADSHKIRTMFVLFDDCWNLEGHLGPQETPIPGVHNSRWVQCPGDAEVKNSTVYPILASYVIDILTCFRDDPRVVIWDLYNEPGNSGHGLDTLPLLQYVFLWARKANTTQPLTSGLWGYGDDLKMLNMFQVDNSDIITFHSYFDLDGFKNIYQWVLDKVGDRPCFCSEYMARLLNCTFETHLPYMKFINVGAINWGLVSGKTQTIYPWGSPPYSPPPKVWFHDIFNKNGSPFDDAEVLLIRNLTMPSFDYFK